MSSWEKEKAYVARRADALEAEMRAAIEDLDKERFNKAWMTASRYMTAKRRKGLFNEFVVASHNARCGRGTVK